jgi:hypothetical protein
VTDDMTPTDEDRAIAREVAESITNVTNVLVECLVAQRREAVNAVLAERDRCADIIRRMSEECNEPVAVSWLVGAMIAIREGKP